MTRSGILMTVLLAISTAQALTVTSLKPYQVIQRTSDKSADHVVTGTRGASVAGIQFQLTQQGSSTPVTGFTWKSTEATVTGTTWTGTLKGLPVGGEYAISLRGVNASGASVETGPTVEHVLVGDIWIASGQSNMGGTSEATSSPYVHMYEPGSDTWSLTQHNLSVSFGKTVYQNSGVPVGITMTVCSGAAITWWADGQPCLGGVYGAIDRFKGGIKGFIWYQGESDAEDGEVGGKARALRYRTNLQTLIDSVRLRSGKPQLPCLIVQIGSLYPAGAIPVRGGQYELARTDPFIATIPVYDLGADLHLTAARQDTAGQRLGYACLRKIFGLSQFYYGPQFRDAWFLDAQKKKIVVRFSDVKTSLAGFTKDPNRYGFFVMDTAVWYRNDSTLNFSYTSPVGMLMPYDSVTLLTPEKLCIHLKSAPTAPVTISYGRASGPSIMGFDLVTDATEIPMATTFGCPVLSSEPTTSSSRGVLGHRAQPGSVRRVLVGMDMRTANRVGSAHSIDGRRIPSGERKNVRPGVYVISPAL